MPSIFQMFSEAIYWRVDFTANNPNTFETVSLDLIKDLLPTNGHCMVDLTNGTSLKTLFTNIQLMKNFFCRPQVSFGPISTVSQ